MKLFAKKPCSFCGTQFYIGNEVPLDYVLDPKAQEKMGVLVVVEGDSVKADSEAGGPLLPPASTLEEKEEKAVYSKYKLSRMTKDELCAIAEEKGVEVTEEMTKDKIVELIIESQGE